MKGLLLRNLYSLRIPVLIVAALAVLFSAMIGVPFHAGDHAACRGCEKRL